MCWQCIKVEQVDKAEDELLKIKRLLSWRGPREVLLCTQRVGICEIL
jgi:hypothetical protein